jgi:sugar/nucleoside kinase (ribokinase family)
MPGNPDSSSFLEKVKAAIPRPGCGKKVLAGFDGFIDSIARPVKQSGGEESPFYFRTIKEFGAYIAGQAHRSGSIELDIVSRRMGGNMPNFSKAAAALGLNLTCIGMLSGKDMTDTLSDSPEAIDPAFTSLSGKLYSFAAAGTAIALEFEDGKIFFAPRLHLENLPSPGFLADCLAGMDLVACLNWGELSFATPLWRNMRDAAMQCFGKSSDGAKTRFFFDLSDFSRRRDEELEGIFSLMHDFSSIGTVTLSLNRNEAQLLWERLFRMRPGKLPDLIRQRYGGITEVVVHSHDGALASRDGEHCEITMTPIASPKLSTGAGDTFNAAYAFAALMELPLEDRLRFAVLYARAYVSEGRSFDLGEFLKHTSLED